MDTAAAGHIHNVVWGFRREAGDRWPTPDQKCSLQFAFTETAEALDACLRLDPAWRRNHDRQMNPDAEIADTLIMLVTALGPVWQPDEGVGADIWSHSTGLHTLAFYVAGALFASETLPQNTARFTEWAVWVAIGLLADPVSAVADRIDRLRQRWLVGDALSVD